MKLHLICLPHTHTIRTLSTCAFTQKAIKFTKMMSAAGYEVVLYSGDQNDAIGCEHVSLYTDGDQRRWYGLIDANTLPTKAGIWDSELPSWKTMNERAIIAIKERAEPRDIILLTGGYAQKPIADAFPGMLVVEWAAGYEGIFSPYVCFESVAWRHYLYGKHRWDGRFYDTVIPNFFDPDEWTGTHEKDDYLLFVGRMVKRKGVEVAVQIAEASGRRLLFAGSGVVEHGPGRIVCEEITLEGDHIEYVGTLDPVERNELMGRAAAVLAPTTYIEPFGAVAVEAQLCGTAAVTTDFGAFTETVAPEYRFTTFQQGLDAVERAVQADPKKLRRDALKRYSLKAIAPLYDEWFTRLDGLWGDGWYQRRYHGTDA